MITSVLQFARSLALGVLQMRTILSLSLALSLGIFQLGFAADSSAVDNSGKAGLSVTAATQLRMLELKYFEHTCDGEDAEERVSRIENLILGQSVEGKPEDRIKSLVSALKADGESLNPYTPVDPTGAGTGAAGSPGRTSTSSKMQAAGNSDGADSVQSSTDTGNYPHVSNLEKEILGKTYEGQTLPARLSRLEVKAFGTASNSSNFSARTDKLEDYAESVLHNKPFAVNKDIDKTYFIPVRPGFNTGNSSPSLATEELAHFFGAPRGLTQEFAPTGPSETQSSNLEDPEVYKKNPPPAGTRMITQVGWCEVQTFGHTFSNMHLTQRLRQLNDVLHAVGGKQSDMALMDDLSPIMNAVLAKKGISAPSISSSSRSTN